MRRSPPRQRPGTGFGLISLAARSRQHVTPASPKLKTPRRRRADGIQQRPIPGSLVRYFAHFMENRRQSGAGMTISEHFETGSKKPRGRGRAKKSIELIDAMYSIVEATQPITGRGVGYKLFTAGLIPSMATSEMQRVYRMLKEAREQGDIPWEWIVDETRGV